MASLTAEARNNLALVQNYLEVSLLKVEVPNEYSGFGTALSTRRRNDAEEGIHHKTAQYLGTLFEQLVPSTPYLINAYGTRATEIVKTKAVNPNGSSIDGPFQAFVGADGTAMWAAARSGIPISALGVYLLACLLARTWEAKQATSIWVELVEERRKEIARGIENNDNVSKSSRIVSSAAISREDLAAWDASVRAWIQSADCARMKQYIQLMLIVKNIDLPASGGSTTYLQVINSWRQAMTGLECLIKGEPQEISNRVILLAYSSWHIYPDLIILGNNSIKVPFGDNCVNSRGVGTLVDQPRLADAHQRMTWSLALSHLRYYGDPVIATNELDASRLSIQQLHLVALGSLYSHWQVSRKDQGSVSQWLICIWDHLEKTFADPNAPSVPVALAPLRCLVLAAQRTTSSDPTVEKEALQLLDWGRRRAKKFLSTSTNKLLPLFGLGNRNLIAGLSEPEDEERGLAYLREVAETNKLRSNDAFIGRFSVIKMQKKNAYLREFCTAVPHSFASGTSHGRWLHIYKEGTNTAEEDSFLDALMHEKMKYIQDRGEHLMRFSEPPVELVGGWRWSKSPLPCDAEEDGQSPSGGHVEDQDKDFSPDTYISDNSPAEFRSANTIGDFELLIRRAANHGLPHPSQVTTSKVPDLEPSESMKICTSQISPSVLAEYLENSLSLCGQDRVRASTGFRWGTPRKVSLRQLAKVKSFVNCKKRLLALRALALVDKIYSQLRGAMISSKIVDKPLDEALWLDPLDCVCFADGEPCRLRLSLPRTNILSCIAQFESGGLAFEPKVFDETLAIASGNSIFGISLLLSDPSRPGSEHCIRRITGNIGRPGISFLVAPVDPRIRPMEHKYDLVTHAPYDGKRENNFQSTSLHLSFTGWAMPVDPKDARTGLIDQDAYFLESIVSVRDKGKWVADLDVLSAFSTGVKRLHHNGVCPGHPEEYPDHDFSSIDTWEELLDRPEEVGIFRAHGNWAARLAAVSILCQQGQDQSIGLLGPEPFCLQCLATKYTFGKGARDGERGIAICVD